MIKIQNNQNAEWKLVKSFTETRIKELQAELESRKDEYETAVIRGKLAFAREILKLDEKKAIIDVPIVDY